MVVVASKVCTYVYLVYYAPLTSPPQVWDEKGVNQVFTVSSNVTKEQVTAALNNQDFEKHA